MKTIKKKEMKTKNENLCLQAIWILLQAILYWASLSSSLFFCIANSTINKHISLDSQSKNF